MANLDIASVAQRSGLPASTLRHYEAKGLIASVGRYGLRRVFDGGATERDQRQALDEIAAMFPPGGGVRIDRAKLAAKADELDLTIHRLGSLRDGLRHASRCPAPSHLECPTFRRLLAGARPAPRRPRKAAP